MKRPKFKTHQWAVVGQTRDNTEFFIACVGSIIETRSKARQRAALLNKSGTISHRCVVVPVVISFPRRPLPLNRAKRVKSRKKEG